MITETQLKSHFKHLKTVAEAVLGYSLDVELEIDYVDRYPNVRDFAKTTGDVVYFSPKILKASFFRMDGLMRHEFAHVIFMSQGDYDHSEREADLLAEAVFGGYIFYDEQDVQTTFRGKRPRPSYLPQ